MLDEWPSRPTATDPLARMLQDSRSEITLTVHEPCLLNRDFLSAKEWLEVSVVGRWWLWWWLAMKVQSWPEPQTDCGREIWSMRVTGLALSIGNRRSAKLVTSPICLHRSFSSILSFPFPFLSIQVLGLYEYR